MAFIKLQSRAAEINPTVYLTRANRAALYNEKYPKYPPLCVTKRWLYGVWDFDEENQQDVLLSIHEGEKVTGIWEIGNDYTNKTGYYGCLSPEVRVLTVDLKWVRQDSLKVGDELVGVTENPPKGVKRKLELSVVEGIAPLELRSYGIVFEDGRRIIASETHLWLVFGRRNYNSGSPTWKSSYDLQVGDRIRQITPGVWPKVDPYEAGWIGGILDGEGSVDNDSGFRVAIAQNPGLVLSQVTDVLTRWGVGFTCRPRKSRIIQDVDTTSVSESLRLLGLASPVRLRRKWVGSGLPIRDGEVSAKVAFITFVGMRPVIGLKTSTRTFISEGLVSHNSYPHGYVDRVYSMFPDMPKDQTLHLFSGPTQHLQGVRVDVKWDVKPTIQATAERLPFRDKSFKFVMADPSYSPPDSVKYGVPHPNKKLVMQDLARVVKPGGHVVWLDIPKPMYRKKEWELWGEIGVLRSTNHRGRFVFIFERV